MLAQSQLSCFLLAPAQLSQFSTSANIFKVRPAGIGQKRWEQLKNEISSRRITKNRTASYLNNRQRAIKEEMST